MYHNTNKLSGQDLSEANKKANTQESKIADLFKNFDSGLTASEVFKEYPDEILLTSVRRGMTNLCTQGKLYKSESMKPGIYGKPEHVYELVKPCLNCQDCNCVSQK